MLGRVLTRAREGYEEHRDFTLLALLFASFRLMALLVFEPGGYILDWSGYYIPGASFVQLSDRGFYPVIHYWIEYPPVFPWLAVIVYRLSAPLIFSNADAFKKTGEALLIKAGAEGALPHTVVVDCEEIPFVDATGAAAVTDLLTYTQRYGVKLALARVHSGTHKLLQLAGVMDEIGEQRIYTTVRGAVDAAVQQNKATTTW